MGEHDKVNILLVDDDPATLLSYEVILSALGEHLIKATSGREALTHLLTSDIAVVLTDVSMPEIDGFALATLIPTVCLSVTCAAADTYGCGDDRISPPRCAVIDAVLGGRYSQCRACRR